MTKKQSLSEGENPRGRHATAWYHALPRGPESSLRKLQPATAVQPVTQPRGRGFLSHSPRALGRPTCHDMARHAQHEASLGLPGITALSSGDIPADHSGPQRTPSLSRSVLWDPSIEPQAPSGGPLATDLGSAEHNGPLSSQKALPSLQRRMAHSEHPEQLCSGGVGVALDWGEERRPGPLLCCVTLGTSLSFFACTSLCRKRRA